MPYVIAEPYLGVEDKSCVAACPVDCVDCGLCEPESPVDAIFMKNEALDQWKNFIQTNKDISAK